ncbi:putative transcription elongation factor 1 [Cercophora samala]|uniref:Transcription elongation factor 1 homolog n=1 Tax=Cercophora samala TaxID=330535 RepID=A0AA39Z4L0_9PEZI|nr:putative transcription elongation factor 1 [Cercophora samala]
MGKRKKATRKPTGPRRNEPLPSVFTCLFCNHEKAVSIKVDKKAGVGSLDCKICGQHFQCGINYLSAPVDVYAEWVDAADAVAQENSEKAKAAGRSSSGRPARRVEADDDEDGYGDVIPDDDDYE